MPLSFAAAAGIELVGWWGATAQTSRWQIPHTVPVSKTRAQIAACRSDRPNSGSGLHPRTRGRSGGSQDPQTCTIVPITSTWSSSTRLLCLCHSVVSQAHLQNRSELLRCGGACQGLAFTAVGIINASTGKSTKCFALEPRRSDRFVKRNL